jgi:serine/threonine-protein kinase
MAAPDAGLAERPASEWRSVPGHEPETVLKTPRVEPAEAVAPPPADVPSVWRRLFPVGVEGVPPSDLGTEPAHGVALGHFTIERRIGAGAMGAVFLAYDERLRRQVALKVLAPQQASDPATVQRFQNEAQAAARLDHEHIARVFYYGQEQDLHFIAYEFVPGINLRDLLRQRGRLTPAETVNYALQIATALRHTSRNGVVHRDIKPSNIIVTSTGRAKLVDLGLAKRDGTEPGGDLTVAGTTLGTFDYISPEQARDPRMVDVRSDLYSLGCTMYHLLTGEPPYPSGTVLQKLLDHQAQDTPDVSAKNRHVPPALSAIVRKLMASDPRRRYATPDELLRDLAVIARGLGLRVVSSDSATLIPEARLRGSWWDQNFGWMVTAAALLAIAATLQLAPGVLERFTVWSERLGHVRENGTSPKEAERGDASTGETVPTESTRSKQAPDSGAQRTDVAAAPSQPSRIAETGGTQDKPPGRQETTANRETSTEPSPPPSATTAVTAAPTVSEGKSEPAIAIVGSETTYQNLEQACAEAKDGQIIELRFDGPRSVSDHTIRLTNKRLTIRGAKGYRPLLEFTETGRAGESATRAIAVSGGSLQLVHVDLAAKVAPSTIGAGWALFSLERPEQLQLDSVTITIANPRRRQASVIEFGASTSSASGMMKTSQPAAPPEIRLANCVVRGAATLIAVREAMSVRFAVEDSLIAVDDALLTVSGRPAMSANDGSQLKLELTHTTAILGGSLIVSRQEENLNDRQVPMLVTAKNNLISVGRDQPLIDLSGGSDAMEVRDSFVWSGERNVYDDVRAFWVIRSRQGVNPLDFFAWKEMWGGEASGSSNGPIRWRHSVRQVALQDVLPEHAALEANGAPNPAIKGAADGTDLGAPLDDLPVPPAIVSER